VIVLLQLLQILGLKEREMKQFQRRVNNKRRILFVKILVLWYLIILIRQILFVRHNLLNIFLILIYLKIGIGEMLVEKIIWVGLLINIYLFTVDLVGLKGLFQLWLTELILQEKMLGLKWL
jgi:hypothetical protein